MDRQILEALKEDSKNPLELEKFLEVLAAKNSEIHYIKCKFQIEKKKLHTRSWESWFQLLGWWFAKLLMYGTLICSVIIVWMFGKEAVGPLTYGLIGAAAYYVLIQVFTPGRIKSEKESISKEEEISLLQQLIEQRYEEKAD